MINKFKAIHTAARNNSNKIDEINDCSVVAVSSATGIPYSKVHKVFKKNGRKDKHGTRSYIILNSIKDLGFLVRNIDIRKEFIENYPGKSNLKRKSITSRYFKMFPKIFKNSKTYIMRNAKHMFSVIDGVCLDWASERSLQIIECWEITKDGE